jgi:hypothetical protein
VPVGGPPKEDEEPHAGDDEHGALDQPAVPPPDPE